MTTSGAPVSGPACAPGFLEVTDFDGTMARVRAAAGWWYMDRNGVVSLTPPGQVPPPSPGDSTGPQVTVTSHSSGATVTSSSITLKGSASDGNRGNSGVSAVSVNGRAASGGTANGSGMATWSWTGPLSRGNNVFTVVAVDASPSRNRSTITLTIRKP